MLRGVCCRLGWSPRIFVGTVYVLGYEPRRRD